MNIGVFKVFWHPSHWRLCGWISFLEDWNMLNNFYKYLGNIYFTPDCFTKKEKDIGIVIFEVEPLVFMAYLADIRLLSLLPIWVNVKWTQHMVGIFYWVLSHSNSSPEVHYHLLLTSKARLAPSQMYCGCHRSDYMYY